jgi:hypothetical protein
MRHRKSEKIQEIGKKKISYSSFLVASRIGIESRPGASWEHYFTSSKHNFITSDQKNLSLPRMKKPLTYSDLEIAFKKWFGILYTASVICIRNRYL